MMTVEIFLTLLVALSAATSFITTGVKKLLDESNKKYSSNMVVFVVAAVVGGLGTCAFYLLNGYLWNIINITCIFMMIPANAFGAMLGYDKVIQTITQIKTSKL